MQGEEFKKSLNVYSCKTWFMYSEFSALLKRYNLTYVLLILNVCN